MLLVDWIIKYLCWVWFSWGDCVKCLLFTTSLWSHTQAPDQMLGYKWGRDLQQNYTASNIHNKFEIIFGRPLHRCNPLEGLNLSPRKILSWFIAFLKELPYWQIKLKWSCLLCMIGAIICKFDANINQHRELMIRLWSKVRWNLLLNLQWDHQC